MTTALDTTHQHGQAIAPQTGNELAEKTTKTPVPLLFGDRGIVVNNIDELWRFANFIIRSRLAPKGIDTPEAIVVVVQFGFELGLPMMTSLQNIAPINGRPAIYGDAALALVQSTGLLESFKEEEIGTPDKDDWGYRVSGKRKGREAASETFTVADAKRAELWGKAGPWKQYPKRMLKFRSRGFFLRDNFGDVLKGLHTVEEVADTEEQRFENAKPVNVTEPAAEVNTGKSKSERMASKLSAAKTQETSAQKQEAEGQTQPKPSTTAAPEPDRKPAPESDSPFREPATATLQHEGVPVRQQVMEWCEEQGITERELCEALIAENVIGDSVRRFSQIRDEKLSHVIENKEAILKAVAFFRSENKR